MKEENIIQFKLFSICDQLRLTLENEGKIFYPPTSVGKNTLKHFKLTNKSNVSMYYKLTIDPK